MNAPQLPLDRRPDIVAMAGPDYDLPSEIPAAKTLILCSAPRTGSYELCRFLMAAGIGIPHEYFHPDFARDFGPRFGVAGNPLDGPNVQPYIDALRKHRGQNGILAINLQYWQLSGALLNGPGNSLFKDAAVVHLFRSDIGNQVTSWRVAMNTGVWDYSGLRTAEGRPFPEDLPARIKQYEEDLKFVAGEDTGFREFFARAGIDPYFITMKELFRDPTDAVHKIAKLLDVPVNKKALKAMIERGKPYPRSEAAYRRATEGLAEHLRYRAFCQE
jgi:LPS sulfotransferase NodH